MKPSSLFRSVFAACALLLGLSGSRAANLDSKGTEFWLGFPEQLSINSENLKLFITGDTATTGTVRDLANAVSPPGPDQVAGLDSSCRLLSLRRQTSSASSTFSNNYQR